MFFLVQFIVIFIKIIKDFYKAIKVVFEISIKKLLFIIIFKNYVKQIDYFINILLISNFVFTKAI